MINNAKHAGLSVSLTKIFGGFSFLATPVIAITLLAGFGCASDTSKPGGHAPTVQPAAETKPAAVTPPLTEIKENALTLSVGCPGPKHNLIVGGIPFPAQPKTPQPNPSRSGGCGADHDTGVRSGLGGERT